MSRDIERLRKQQATEDPLLRQADVARLLNCSPSTISRWVKLGLLQTVQAPNGGKRIRLSDVGIEYV